MEAQPPPQPTPPLPSPVSPQQPHYPDSLDSSPRSRNTDSWDEPYPPPTANNLRLMVSYGGHISPRPHDKTLCYIGGETRIVVVDRHTSLSDLSTRFSKTFLNGLPFALKYQLPNEDLDSLISVTTDEDFENMIEEFDQRSSNSSSSKPSRIRLFLFPAKPDSSGPVSVFDGPGSGLDSGKSEDWLTGSGYLDGGLSESASVNCLIGLDEEVAASRSGSNNFASGLEDAAAVAQVGSGKNLKQGQDVQSMVDSPMPETNSSFGSTSSSPSVANLPSIKAHVEDGGSTGGGVRGQDQKVEGIEEQFAKLGVGGVGQKQDEEIVVLPSPVNVSPVPVSSAVVAAGEYQNRVVSDDERSDQGVPLGCRKLSNSELSQSQAQAQAQALPPQFQLKSTGVVDLPSPDLVSSDSSLTNALSRRKPVNVINQDRVQIQSGASGVPITSVDPNHSVSDPHSLVQMQQHVPDPRYVLQHQFGQQQQQQQLALQHQFDQQQQQHSLQHQFDQQQKQQALQHQFDQQQQQRQQQQLALQHQFDQQRQQQALQHQFDQQQQQQALQHQFDQQKQQQASEHQFDQQQQHQQQQALQHQFDQQQQQQQALQHQFDQQQQQEAPQPQQIIHGTHFIHQTHAGPVSIPAYYPVYPSQQQLHPQHHYQLDQQYPVYYLPARQAQAYNLSMQQQANLGESATTIPSSQPQIPPNPAAMVPPSSAYPPMRNAPLPNSEMATAKAYRTAAASTPQLVQVPSTQHQQQYVAYSQIHPSQSMAPNSAASPNYAYNYADPAQAQIFYAQNLAPTKPSQSRP